MVLNPLTLSQTYTDLLTFKLPHTLCRSIAIPVVTQQSRLSFYLVRFWVQLM